MNWKVYIYTSGFEKKTFKIFFIKGFSYKQEKWINTSMHGFKSFYIWINTKNTFKAAAQDPYKGWLNTLHISTDFNCSEIQRPGFSSLSKKANIYIFVLFCVDEGWVNNPFGF
jgi:hypothetical protein